MAIVRGGSFSNVDLQRIEELIILNSGQLLYTISNLPNALFATTATVNGIDINFDLVGVNLTITEYTAGTVETGWEMKVIYFI